MKDFSIHSIPTLFLLLQTSSIAEAQSSYGGCNVDTYYNGVNQGANSATLRRALQNLLSNTHRGVWPSTNPLNPGIGDTWGALMDLDQGSFPGKIKLVFSGEEVDAVPFGGGTTGWSKQRLFPASRGLGNTGIDVADLHNMRASDYISDLVRAEKYFGECGVLTQADTCVEPAEGGAEGTCTCNRIYTPPPGVRGDIARALMYMDVRYDGSDPDTLDLRLTDCPFQPERDMAYLSQLLTWHQEDPVDDAERIRNDRVCNRWQGNRNPFVDYPNLAEQLYGQPLPLPAIGERTIYEACEIIPTQAPTTAPNQCERLEDGDIYVWLVNSKDPDAVGLFAFEDMDAGFKIYMTTNPWNGTDFVTTQGGTISLELPQEGMDGGSPFGWGDGALQYSNSWETESGAFSLSPDGQPIFIYCLDNFDNVKPILGFLYNNATWITESPVNGTFTVGESLQPSNLGVNGLVQIATNASNIVFDGEIPGGNLDTVKFIIRNPNNWKSSNSDRFSAPSGAWSVMQSSAMVVSATAGLAALLLLQ